jgi:hypothetical protein
VPPDTKIAVADEAPWSDGINAYDEAQFRLYLRLLDAVEANAANDEICKVLFNIDAEREPARAQKCLESHLRRARWMTEHGYRELLRRDGTAKPAPPSRAKH